MQIIHSTEHFFRLDTEDSGSVSDITVWPALAYDILPAAVHITYKSDESVSYAYDVADRAHLLYTILTEQSAGRLANWVKASAERTSRIGRDSNGEIVVKVL